MGQITFGLAYGVPESKLASVGENFWDIIENYRTPKREPPGYHSESDVPFFGYCFAAGASGPEEKNAVHLLPFRLASFDTEKTIQEGRKESG